MAKRTYVATLEPAEGGLGVSFEDLPGCVSFGATLPEAITAAEEALSLHLEGMAEDNEPFPDAKYTGGVAGEVPAGAMFAAITVEAPDAAERVNVYLQRSLLERIDRFADNEGINRSGFFNQAARRYLDDRQPGMILDAQLATVLRRLLMGSGPAMPPPELAKTPAVEALYAGDIREALKSIQEVKTATEGLARSLSIGKPK